MTESNGQGRLSSLAGEYTGEAGIEEVNMEDDTSGEGLKGEKLT